MHAVFMHLQAYVCVFIVNIYLLIVSLQKLVVDLVKLHKKAVTLAIGDGANDVGMIKGTVCIIIMNHSSGSQLGP